MNQTVSPPVVYSQYSGPRTHAEMIAAKKEREARYRAVAVESELPPRRKTTEELLAEQSRKFEARLEAEKAIRLEKQIKREIRAALIEARNHSALSDLSRPSIRKVIYVVAGSFNISSNDILSNRRNRTLSFPRQVAMYISKSTTLHSFPEIGRQFKKDHTTVLHAVKKITAMMASDEAFRAKVEAIEAAINGGSQ